MPTLRSSSLRALRAVAALTLAFGLQSAAQAHRLWMMPSATVLSGDSPWVTVDAAVSNDVFFFEFLPVPLDNLVITGPDGRSVTPENLHKGKLRSSFDLPLAKPGTYRVALVMQPIMAAFKVGEETKRLRGTAESLAKDIPAGATLVSATQTINRIETFVTAGRPDQAALAPTGVGLEMVPITHPNDLVAGQPARMRFLLNGAPAAGLTVSVVPGGNRYRDQLGDFKVVTDPKGEVTITWQQPGMHWLNAEPPRAARGEHGESVGTLQAPQRRYNYVATVEVLPR